jgi:hypothetical protein
MERGPAGVVLNVDLHDQVGKLIARVVGTKTDVLTGENVRLEHSGDLSTLIVTNAKGEELLYVRYLNPTTVRIRGVFSCPGRPGAVRVEDGKPIMILDPGEPPEPLPFDTTELVQSDSCSRTTASGIWIK